MLETKISISSPVLVVMEIRSSSLRDTISIGESFPKSRLECDCAQKGQKSREITNQPRIPLLDWSNQFIG
jgi:hypothetical protein